MKLSNNTLKRLVKGACFYKEEKGFLYPYRYTSAQLDHFKERLDFWYTRALLQAGVKIEFVTNAKSFSFEYYTGEVYSGDNSVDVYVNDFAYAVHNMEVSGKARLDISLPDGKKKITVYLPIDVSVGIKNFVIDGKWKSVNDRKIKLLAIGDSITQGYGAKIAGSSYINSLYRKTKFDILSQGIGGYRYEKGSIMLIDNFKPDRILVALGTNYHDDKTYDYEKHIEEFYRALNDTYGNVPIISVTPIYRCDPGYDPERFALVCDKIRTECAKYPNISVLEGFTVVPHIKECFVDLVHPNAYGNELMAENIKKFMKKIKF